MEKISLKLWLVTLKPFLDQCIYYPNFNYFYRRSLGDVTVDGVSAKEMTQKITNQEVKIPEN